MSLLKRPEPGELVLTAYDEARRRMLKDWREGKGSVGHIVGEVRYSGRLVFSKGWGTDYPKCASSVRFHSDQPIPVSRSWDQLRGRPFELALIRSFGTCEHWQSLYSGRPAF
jgi:hypothetical protein